MKAGGKNSSLTGVKAGSGYIKVGNTVEGVTVMTKNEIYNILNGGQLALAERRANRVLSQLKQGTVRFPILTTDQKQDAIKAFTNQLKFIQDAISKLK